MSNPTNNNQSQPQPKSQPQPQLSSGTSPSQFEDSTYLGGKCRDFPLAEPQRDIFGQPPSQNQLVHTINFPYGDNSYNDLAFDEHDELKDEEGYEEGTEQAQGMNLSAPSQPMDSAHLTPRLMSPDPQIPSHEPVNVTNCSTTEVLQAITLNPLPQASTPIHSSPFHSIASTPSLSSSPQSDAMEISAQPRMNDRPTILRLSRREEKALTDSTHVSELLDRIQANKEQTAASSEMDPSFEFAPKHGDLYCFQNWEKKKIPDDRIVEWKRGKVHSRKVGDISMLHRFSKDGRFVRRRFTRGNLILVQYLLVNPPP